MKKKGALAIIVIPAIAGLALLFARVQVRNELSLGIALLKEGRYVESLRTLQPYAEQGQPVARIIVGRIHALGLGVRRDRDEARKWFSCEGVKGCTPGENEYFIAKDYLDGAGIGRERTEAIFWMKVSRDSEYMLAKEWLDANMKE